MFPQLKLLIETLRIECFSSSSKVRRGRGATEAYFFSTALDCLDSISHLVKADVCRAFALTPPFLFSPLRKDFLKNPSSHSVTCHLINLRGNFALLMIALVQNTRTFFNLLLKFRGAEAPRKVSQPFLNLPKLFHLCQSFQ